jgi:hypothetical protein
VPNLALIALGDSHHWQGGMKFATQISPLLNLYFKCTRQHCQIFAHLKACANRAERRYNSNRVKIAGLSLVNTARKGNVAITLNQICILIKTNRSVTLIYIFRAVSLYVYCFARIYFHLLKFHKVPTTIKK